MKRAIAATIIAGLLVSACGTNSGDRAISGAGIGAATGAIGTAVFGGSALTGAAVGAAAGAITGAATNPDSVNLGKPWWR